MDSKKCKKIPKISDGFNIAMSPRRGPVCINLPRNILAEKNTFKINEKINLLKIQMKLNQNPNYIKKAVKIINNSNKSSYYCWWWN